MSYNAGYGYSQPAWDSEYDSTWEEDEEAEEPKSKKMKTFHQNNRWGRAARDLQNYRHGYPDESYMPNLLFYQNKIPFEPYGEYIDIMHKSWCNDYNTLEINHNFIQWLFPLREPGVNRHASPLTLSEIQMMKRDKRVMKRLLESYKLMLGFYGIVLLDEDTGEVTRAGDNWENRFYNLNTHTHNNLRITRILKCLGEMGYEKFQAPLVMFFLKETLCNGNLPNVKGSALDYFVFTVKDKEERQKLVHFSWMHYTPQDRFIWGPVDKLQRFNPMPKKLDCEIEIPGELNVKLKSSKSDSSEDYCVIDIDVTGEEPESKREETYSLVKRNPGYIARPFLAFSRFVSWLFVPFYIFLYRPFRCLIAGRIFWLRGGARNEDRLNEEQSVKTEGARTETLRLVEGPERKVSHKAELKELDGQSDNSMDESKKEAKLETEQNWSKYESAPEDDTELKYRKPLYNIKSKQGKENDNGAENEDNSENFTKDGRSKNVMKLDKGPTSVNERLERSEKDSEKEDEHTKDSGTDNSSGVRRDFGTLISNMRIQFGDVKTGGEGASNVELGQLFGRQGDVAKSSKISRIEGNRDASIVGSEDNDGEDIGSQNTESEKPRTEQVKRVDHKTTDFYPNSETKEGVNETQEPVDGSRELDVYPNSEADEGVNETQEPVDENREIEVYPNSKADEGVNGTQEPVDWSRKIDVYPNSEADEGVNDTQEPVDGSREIEVYPNSEADEGVNETQEPIDGSGEIEGSERYNKLNKQEEDGAAEHKLEQAQMLKAAGEAENLESHKDITTPACDD